MVEKARILVVEDDEQQRESMVENLTNLGYDVREASSGNDAIPLLYGTSFNLVLLDLKMPYIDGLEVLKFVKGTFPKTKVIIITAYGDLTNIERCKKLGADDVVEKPYNFEYLMAILRDTIIKSQDISKTSNM